MADGANNARFLSNIDSKSKSFILESIAKHYGITTSEALAEVTGSEAEHLLDYLTGPAQRYASVLMQAKGMRGFSRSGQKDTMATRKPKVREQWETVFYEYFRNVPVSIMDSGKIKNDINALLASGADLKVEMPKLVKKYGRFSRPGAKDTMAREVVARKGSKRVELSGPNGNGQWVVTVMQEEKQVVPGEANDRFVESKFYSTEAAARRAASKILASRPGAKDTMAVEDRFYFGKERFAEKNDGWALQSVNVPDWGTHHFPSEAAARKYAVEKGYNHEMRLLYNGKTVAIKRWDNTWSNR